MKLKDIEKEAKKKLIIKSSIKLFNKYGYENTTISQITKDVKIAKGTIYLYFKSKLDILLEIVSFALNKMVTDAKNIKSSNLAADEKLKKIAKLNVELVKDYPEYHKIFSMLHHDSKPETKKRVSNMFYPKNNKDNPLGTHVNQLC